MTNGLTHIYHTACFSGQEQYEAIGIVTVFFPFSERCFLGELTKFHFIYLLIFSLKIVIENAKLFPGVYSIF
jgi:hypothetical protein